MAYANYMPQELSQFLRSQELQRAAPRRITEEAYNAGVDPNIDTTRDRYPIKPVNEPVNDYIQDVMPPDYEPVNEAGVPQPSVPMPPPDQGQQIADDSPYGVYQSGKGRGQQNNPNQAPQPYNPYAGTGGPRPIMAPPNNSYFGGQGDVFGRPDYMYGNPQRSPYAPQQPYMPQQQPMKGGNPYQRPQQQPMKGGARPNFQGTYPSPNSGFGQPNFQMGGGFNPYVGGGYQPQPQKGGSPYGNQGFGSGPVNPSRAMTDPRYRFQNPANPNRPEYIFQEPTLPMPPLTGGVTPLPADFDASSQGVIGPGQQGDGSTLDASGLDFKTGSVSNNMTGGPTPPPLGFDPTVAPNIDQTQNYLSNDNVSPNKGGGSQRYNPYQGTGYNPNSGKGGSSY